MHLFVVYMAKDCPVRPAGVRVVAPNSRQNSGVWGSWPVETAGRVSRRTRRLRVVMVEREASNTAVTSGTLEDLGFDIVGRVGSGRAAFEMVASHNPNLVIVDTSLVGDEDGIAV